MKRRTFIQGLLGVAAIPVVAKAAPKFEHIEYGYKSGGGFQNHPEGWELFEATYNKNRAIFAEGIYTKTRGSEITTIKTGGKLLVGDYLAIDSNGKYKKADTSDTIAGIWDGSKVIGI